MVNSITAFVAIDHMFFFFFFQAEDGIRDVAVTGVQTCALPILAATGEGAEMTKPEIPMPKECRMTENSNPFPGADPFSEFGFRISFGIRPLAFEIGRASCRERV